ncbi:MAG: VWA domain-containing protein [Saprospiraceae bacterium]|nr:VWA domain-containing protein [Saprospiraceae bacterium]
MIRFEHIEYLWALAALPLLGILYLLAQRFRAKALVRLGELNLIDRLGPQLSERKRRWKSILLFLGMAFLILGVANPQWGTRQQKVKRQSADIFYALDISKSMLAQDIRPSRLDRAKRVILDFASNFKTERQGLILFAADSYLALPLTLDYSALELIASTANPNQAGTQGTSLLSVIQKAEESFQEGDNRQRLLIILTDGEDHEDPALEAAKAAQETGLVICTIGMGTDRGARIPLEDINGQGFQKDQQNREVISKLNVGMLEELASAGGGLYLPLDNSDNMTSLLRKFIDRLEKQEFEETIFTEYESYFQYFLALGLIFLLIEFFLGDRKGTVFSTLRN